MRRGWAPASCCGGGGGGGGALLCQRGGMGFGAQQDRSCSPRAGCRLIYRWDSGRPAAAGQARRTGRLSLDSSTPATCGRRGLIGGDSGRGAALRLQGPGDRSKNDPPASCAPPASLQGLSRAPAQVRSSLQAQAQTQAQAPPHLQLRRAQQLLRASSRRLVTAAPVRVINGVCKCKCKCECKCRRPQFLAIPGGLRPRCERSSEKGE